VLNLIILLLRFCIDKFVIHDLSWSHAYWQDIVSFIITSMIILIIAVPEGLPVAVMVSLAYSVKVRIHTTQTAQFSYTKTSN